MSLSREVTSKIRAWERGEKIEPFEFELEPALSKDYDIPKKNGESSLHPATDDLNKFLNEVFELDRDAVSTLIETRVPCSKKMKDHSTIQVTRFGDLDPVHPTPSDDQPMVGLLGLLNGFCGVFTEGTRKGCGPIVAHYDDNDLKTVTHFSKGDSPPVPESSSTKS
jgi:hypothetical protein